MEKSVLPFLFMFMEKTLKLINMWDIPEDLTKNLKAQKFPFSTFVYLSVPMLKDCNIVAPEFKLQRWLINNYPDFEGQEVLIRQSY